MGLMRTCCAQRRPEAEAAIRGPCSALTADGKGRHVHKRVFRLTFHVGSSGQLPERGHAPYFRQGAARCKEATRGKGRDTHPASAGGRIIRRCRLAAL